MKEFGPYWWAVWDGKLSLSVMHSFCFCLTVRKHTELEEQAAELEQKNKRLAELSTDLEEKNVRLVHQSARLKDLTAELEKKDAKLKKQAAEQAQRNFLLSHNTGAVQE
ncbi:uncharacterized protein [Anas platyrhynchos]|uniref:uncharacterized protein isoform X1 n=1 Tax=Anas platyrhynchos TaxID=8839 RepID=UPI003AF2BD20